jgi:hypothetical protein
MLGAENLGVRVVVEKAELFPTRRTSGTGLQQSADDGTQRLRPCIRWANWRLGPVVRAHEGACTSASGQRLERVTPAIAAE